jgi:3-hydroxyacyl-CoA dehydrogenase
LASALWREAVHIVAEGIADVADVDAALVNGPGLRWAVMGAHMTYHLGGGAGGIESYLRHLGPSQERRWQSLGSPRLTLRVRRKLIEGVLMEAAGRSIETLERERDAKLIRILRARKWSRR